MLPTAHERGEDVEWKVYPGNLSRLLGVHQVRSRVLHVLLHDSLPSLPVAIAESLDFRQVSLARARSKPCRVIGSLRDQALLFAVLEHVWLVGVDPGAELPDVDHRLGLPVRELAVDHRGTCTGSFLGGWLVQSLPVDLLELMEEIAPVLWEELFELDGPHELVPEDQGVDLPVANEAVRVPGVGFALPVPTLPLLGVEILVRVYSPLTRAGHVRFVAQPPVDNKSLAVWRDRCVAGLVPLLASVDVPQLSVLVETLVDP